MGATWRSTVSESEKEVKSEPPTGKYQVKNLYVDPATGKLVVEYEDTPAP